MCALRSQGSDLPLTSASLPSALAPLGGSATPLHPLSGPTTPTASQQLPLQQQHLQGEALQEHLLAMAAVDGVESGSGNELTPTAREWSLYHSRMRAENGESDPVDFEGRDHFMDEEESDDELIRADASETPLQLSRRQAADLEASNAPAFQAEAPPASDAPVASPAAVASAARVQAALPSDISDFQSCASAVSMAHQG